MAQEIEAPLAGVVIKLNIKLGDKVKEDDEALILEAMKMETPVFVPCDGTVVEVRVNEGVEVEEDDILALIAEGQSFL